MSEDQTITIEIDGKAIQAAPGQMLIEVTDAAGIDIPRFCYHKKLSVSANCRMCLVEVERAPKPLPACATPVNDGMKVFTRSPIALAAQKGTMEFLLINHPLDCPICDQGGECELQDISMGYGSDISRFVEGKRIVKDKDIGPLITTDLTRCIHCTRCVRFGAEIAGIRELGATGRGEHMTIGTYIEKSVDSELSGNIIDVCPVGSLTSKPSQFKARAWEMLQRDTIAPHDSVGSNIHVHVRRNELIRVHPKDNESINECWISDRDRFSYEGVYSDDRLTTPMIKSNGEWRNASWDEALAMVVTGLKNAGADIGALLSPNATVEELYLAQKLIKSLGSERIDSRLRQGDFRGEAPSYPWLGQSIESLEKVDAALLVGSSIRKEQPMLAHRLRKAALEGAQISFINPLELDLNYAAQQLVTTPAGMITELACVAKAAGANGDLIDQAEVTEVHKLLAEKLKGAANGALLLGNLATAHADYSIIRSLATAIATACDLKLGYLPEASNSIGAHLVGAVASTGNDAQAMLETACKGYLLMGIEPGLDLWNPAKAANAFEQADFVVALTAFRSANLEAAADVLLPMALFVETSGSFVNAEGTLQSFAGVITPSGNTRPAWKILRVLGNLLEVPGFDYVDTTEVLAEITQATSALVPNNAVSNQVASTEVRTAKNGLQRIGDVPIYALDPLVRHARSLQKTHDAIPAGVYLNAEEAGKLGVTEGDNTVVVQDQVRIQLPLFIDPNVPNGCARIPAALAGVEQLGAQFGEVTLEKV
ncbi:NADH-quinone oxidoreductase subunit NuoG [Sedimenticola selenatireducens]|uniref:NADH-quinone oxidoreductase n=1 Tax=Sedimenticola selenatireducens TaxID=191960 RepID=A0A558DKK1_9GAMM|nr:NADH-quinone oxidoreductase subunit NuoG [Sedimenticola selenatireducens]TVO71243.1 NADH-quinone oxidoreductase subunit G [Sedimenticola selenatireducens]TVT61545.1 MAG: NADH-quinone oxidoreductase subunit G [Sedimenticola selenatireducens]